MGNFGNGIITDLAQRTNRAKTIAPYIKEISNIYPKYKKAIIEKYRDKRKNPQDYVEKKDELGEFSARLESVTSLGSGVNMKTTKEEE